MKSFIDFITGRSLAKSKQLVRDRESKIKKLLDRIEEKDDDLDCALWWVDQQDTQILKQVTILQREQEKFQILANYVDRLVSAIAGTETHIFDGSVSNIDNALEDAIASALEQNKQLLYSRTQLSKSEEVLAELRNIVAQIPSNPTI